MRYNVIVPAGAVPFEQDFSITKGGEGLPLLTFSRLQTFLRRFVRSSLRPCRTVSILLALGMVVSLGGCSRLQTSVEDLMSPPVLTQEQAQIRSALSQVIGDPNIKYKYPQNGDYRSSFIFYDLDDDEEEEALVFYQSASKGAATWINILDRLDSGEWISVCETPAPNAAANIDFVSFEHLIDENTTNLVIGWEDDRSNKTVLAYRYNNNRLLPIFERDYTEIAITDLDSNGSTDLVLFYRQAQSTLVFLACKTENGFETVDSAQLDRGIVSFDNILSGKSSNSSNALFLDSTIDLYETPFQITDVISAKRQVGSTPKLVNLLDNEFVSLSQSTLRPAQNLFCRDIDGDGIVELPTITPLPGYTDVFDENSIFLTTYNTISSSSQLIARRSGVINTQHRYMIVFPDRWLKENVSAVVQPENGEWTFFAYTNELNDTSNPLLKIRVYSAKDYHDKFDDNYFHLIRQKGLFEYYAYLPKAPQKEGLAELAITEEELTNSMFFLLD